MTTTTTKVGDERVARHALTDAEAIALIGDDIDFAEYEQGALTDQERRAIAEYVRHTAGTGDSFIDLERVDIADDPSWSTTIDQVRQYVTMLDEWQAAQAELFGAAANTDTGYGELTPAVRRFTDLEHTRFAEARRRFYRALLTTLIGRVPWSVVEIRDRD